MRQLIIILTLFPLLALGQVKKSTDNKIPLYFPPLTFECKKNSDKIYNEYWSMFLTSFKKSKLYQDTTDSEYYRLLYYGNYVAIVEIFKYDDKYIVIADSLANDIKLYRHIDTLKNEILLKQVDTLSILSGQFWKIRSYEHCTQDEDIIMEDDRDNWVIEIKKGKKYHAISRIIPDKNMTKFINIVMDLGQLHGYKIYYTSTDYNEY